MKRIPTIAMATLFPALVAGFFPFPTRALVIRAGVFETPVPEDTLRSFSSIETEFLPTSTIPSEMENVSRCTVPIFCGDFGFSRRSREKAYVATHIRADLPSISRYVDSVTRDADSDAKGARFGENEAREIVLLEEGQAGQKLDRPGAVLAIRDALESGSEQATLPVTRIDPPVPSDPERLGIRELIAEGTTDFRGSTVSRIHNIRRALEQFQGLVIAPGEEFSFVGNLGEVDGEHGYLPELVIKYDRTEPEYGGGICQVSSTLFRAAINAGFKITARKNHAYPVSYYKPYGMDATVYIPSPDMRFVNNTPSHVLIQSEIVGTKLSFRLYGTDDGREVVVDGPHILESNPDGSMKTTFSQTVTDSAGGTVIADEFRSSYKSPDLFPHPEDILTEKPDDWSKKQWQEYLDLKRS